MRREKEIGGNSTKKGTSSNGMIRMYIVEICVCFSLVFNSNGFFRFISLLYIQLRAFPYGI